MTPMDQCGFFRLVHREEYLVINDYGHQDNVSVALVGCRRGCSCHGADGLFLLIFMKIMVIDEKTVTSAFNRMNGGCSESGALAD